MEIDKVGWIDPATARRLLLEFRQTLGVKGGSEIERQINKYTRLGISRKTIENWLNDPDSAPSSQTLKIVQRFLQTEHFQKIVPRARDYLETDARLLRRGTALFDLYGAKELDATECTRLNSLIHGWWSGPLIEPAEGGEASNFLYIDTIEGQPFSRAYVLMSAGHVLRGAGIVFPLNDADGVDRFEARIWPRSTLQENSMTIFSAMNSPRAGGFMVVYQTRDQPHRFFHEAFFPAVEESVPEEVRSSFESWRGDVIPHDPTGSIEA